MACDTIRFLGWIAAICLMAVIGSTEASSDDLSLAKPEKPARAAEGTPAVSPAETAQAAKAGWVDLPLHSDGHWKASRFGGDGEVEYKDGGVTLGFGDPLTGIYWDGKHPRVDYEISLEARRTAGFDFFCGLTVPVEDQRCSLILGGWGGSLLGISSIDGRDASENETMQFLQFEQDKWYRVRFWISRTQLRVWLDDKQIIEVDRAGRQLDIRPELEFSVPLGVAAYQCESQIRNIRYRMLTDAEKSPAPPAAASPTPTPTPVAGQDGES